jgi:mRNA interferase MazF
MSRGDIYLADLNPSRGSEQAGIRPVVIIQREAIDRFTQTIVIVPLQSPPLEHSRHLHHSR